MRIVLIGAGNLATNIGKALKAAGHDIAQVYSRTIESASALAAITGSQPSDDLSKVVTDADVYIISVKDSIMPHLIRLLCKERPAGVFLHTAGSIPMNVFKGEATYYGVLYPMQTFSKSKDVDFGGIPCFIEAVDGDTLRLVEDLARSISRRVYRLSSEDRKYLHLAAVFSCNFVNHCYAMTSELLEARGIPFDVMLPLIDETASKVHELSPREAQTGPAVRFDENVINAQSGLLDNKGRLKDIYVLMSRSIHEAALKYTDKND